MPERLGALDASFLYVEEQATPMHVGTVAVFTPGDRGFGYEDLIALVRSRLGLVPRFRQRVKSMPIGLAGPVWIDDPDFDVTYHVRRSALPGPGDVEQLCDLVARLVSRPLDRHRPLWELYLVEGLTGGRFALVSKTHLAMIDGVAAVDLAEVILNPSPGATNVGGSSTPWEPEPEPSGAELIVQAAVELARRPSRLLESARVLSKDTAASAASSRERRSPRRERWPLPVVPARIRCGSRPGPIADSRSPISICRTSARCGSCSGAP